MTAHHEKLITAHHKKLMNMHRMFGEIKENNVFYCKDCNKIYNSCYELEGDYMCSNCWSEVNVIEEKNITAFIRNKKLKKLKEISDNE